MRILLVSVLDPFSISGFGNLAKRLFNTLQADGHQLGCLVCTQPEKSDFLYEKFSSSGLFSLGVHILPEQFFYYASDKIKAVFSRHPSSLLEQNCNRFHKKMKSICEEESIDMIHCFLFETVLAFPENPPAPVVFDYFDSSTRHRLREIKYYATFHTTEIPKALISLLSTLRIEYDLLHKFAETGVFTVMSAGDASMLNKLCPNIKVHQVPATIESEEKTMTFSRSIDISLNNIVGFYGYLGGAYNLDALKILVEKVMPKVRKKKPNAVLKITGISISKEILELPLKYDWIEVIENVDDIRDFLKLVRLCCFPYRLGSGIKTKVIECMALGVPVVTTSLGLEGFSEKQKQGILVADTPLQISGKIIQLIENNNICDELVQKNYDIIQKEFSSAAQATAYINAYKEAIALHS
jgi:glycosyltransferase involved in cell wall biosynthesis